MKVFVLAAGYATRLGPESRERAKPLLDIAGRPLLDRLLERVLALDGISEIVVIANARFAAQFEAWSAASRRSVPVRVLNDGSTDDAHKLGAIGDLAFALREVPLAGEDWLVVAGDNLIDFDLRPALADYRAEPAPLLLVRRFEADGPSRYNEVTLGEGGRVVRFREKPADPETDLAAIALYFFPPAVSGALERYLEAGGEPDAPGHFIAWLVEQQPVRALLIGGGWFDVGTPADLERTRARFEHEPGPRG